MKSALNVFAFAFRAVARLALSVWTAAFTFALYLGISAMMLMALPFWVTELMTAKSRKFVRFASPRECECYPDWMFSRTTRVSNFSNKSSVRLWGVEFEYAN